MLTTFFDVKEDSMSSSKDAKFLPKRNEMCQIQVIKHLAFTYSRVYRSLIWTFTPRSGIAGTWPQGRATTKDSWLK